MLGRHGEDERFAKDDLRFEFIIVYRRPQKSDRDAALAQGLELLRHDEFTQRQHHVGMMTPERPHDQGHEAVAGGMDEADGQLAGAAGPRGADLSLDGFRGFDQVASALEKDPAGRCERDRPVGSDEERHLEAPLEILDLPRDGRLRAVQAAGRPPEM